MFISGFAALTIDGRLLYLHKINLSLFASTSISEHKYRIIFGRKLSKNIRPIRKCCSLEFYFLYFIFVFILKLHFHTSWIDNLRHTQIFSLQSHKMRIKMLSVYSIVNYNGVLSMRA